MSRLVLGLMGATALTMASAANATLIISTSTEVSAITGPNSPDGGMHYTFSYTSTCGAGGVTCVTTPPPANFEATVSFMNDAAGFYGLGIQTTATEVDDGMGGLMIDPATDVDFTNAWIALTDGTLVQALTPSPANDDVHEAWDLSGLHLAAGSYVIHITGDRGDASSFDGNLNFAQSNAVPEPATWAMMLLGFGAIGWQLRRRRTGRALAQAV
jgi:hypothetical protein